MEYVLMTTTSTTVDHCFPVKSVLIMLVLLCVLGVIVFILCSYFVLKALKLSIDHNNVLFYHYNKQSQKILDKYGNYVIRRIYLTRQPFSKCISLLLNALTLYQYKHYLGQSQDNFPFHTLLLLELEEEEDSKQDQEQDQAQRHEKTKWITLEKNNCVQLSENFLMHASQERMELKKPDTDITLTELVNQTHLRVGKERYFNWHLFENNCQDFTKEVLITLGHYTRVTHEFVFRDKLLQLIVPSEFMLHVGNCLCVLYNGFEKYIYESLL